MLPEPLPPLVVLAALSLFGLACLFAWAHGYGRGHARAGAVEAAARAELQRQVKAALASYAFPPARTE